MAKICPDKTDCGYVAANDAEQFCPDCGKTLVAGNGATAQAIPATPAPMLEDTTPLMPAEDVDTRPVIKALGLPYTDKAGKKEKDMREGDTFSVAREGTQHDVDMIVPADKDGAVSASDPFVITIRNGQMVAKGGGTNGYKVTWVQPFVASAETVLGSLPVGQAAMTIVLGAKTPIRVK